MAEVKAQPWQGNEKRWVRGGGYGDKVEDREIQDKIGRWLCPSELL